MKTGSFIFVLHSHVPYVRKSGKWPHGEEMLFEIIAETYIPLLNTFENLYRDKIYPRISLGLTPILLEQLNDPYMQHEFVKYIKERIKAAHIDRQIFKESQTEALDVNEFYINWYQNILNDYENKYKRNLISAFKFYQDNAGLDILTSAATHGYLPLLSKDSAIWGQLKTGIKQYKKLFDREPTGIWLPECGYRPLTQENRLGIESFLEEVGLKYFFTDSHVIEAAVKNGDVNGIPPTLSQVTYLNSQTNTSKPSRNIVLRNSPESNFSTFHPYTVADSNVYVFGRDKATGMQVWSAEWGYPGDFVYREFHKKASTSGIQYWKISNKKQGMKYKELYSPSEAFSKAKEQANHFVTLVKDRLTSYHDQSNKHGVLVSSYDTELFGHWWFEGVSWLENVIRALTTDSQIELVSAREFIATQPITSEVQIPESSWGNGGQHSTWLNADTEYIWPQIHQAESRFEQIAGKNITATGIKKKLLNQAAREILLLQSSDWPFLITTVQARDYATERFREHLSRFNLICDLVDNDDLSLSEDLQDIFDKDNIFKQIDFRDFI